MPCEIQYAAKPTPSYIVGALVNAKELFSVKSETDWGRNAHDGTYGYCRISDADVTEVFPYFMIIPEPGGDEAPKLVTGYRFILRPTEVASFNNAVFTMDDFKSNLVDRVTTAVRTRTRNA